MATYGQSLSEALDLIEPSDAPFPGCPETIKNKADSFMQSAWERHCKVKRLVLPREEADSLQEQVANEDGPFSRYRDHIMSQFILEEGQPGETFNFICAFGAVPVYYKAQGE